MPGRLLAEGGQAVVNINFLRTRLARAVPAHMKPVWVLVLVLTAVAGGTGATMLGVLYHAAFAEERQRLIEHVRCTTSILEASTAFVRTHRPSDTPGGVEAAVLGLMQEAHTRYERFSEGVDITLTQRQDDDIVFLLAHRHEEHVMPAPVPFDAQLAEPARRALAGASGTVVGLDFRGVEVLAAYAPVPTLGLGVVTKIDLSAIHAPFLRAGGLAGGLALLLIAIGAWLFFRISDPMQRRSAESEARFRGISSAAQDAVIVMASDGQVSFWNSAAERVFGYPRDDALGRPVSDLIVPARYRARHETGLARFRQTGEGPLIGQTTELAACTQDGHEIPIEISLAALWLEATWHAVAIIRDISERKAHEQQAQQRQELLAQVIEHIPHAVFWKDRESVYLGCNRRFAVHAGLETPAQVVGKTDFDLAWTEAQAEFYRSVDRAVLASGQARLNLEEPQHRADGTDAMLLTSKVALRDAAGDVRGLLGVYADITERTQAEAALRAKTEELEAIYQALPDLLFRVDQEGAILDYARGPRAPALYLPPAEFLGKRMQDLLPEPTAGLFAAALSQIATDPSLVTFEYRLRMAEGERDFEARLVPLRAGEVLILVRDVTEHKTSVRALAEREAQLRLILASTGEGIFGINKRGRCTFANRACVELLGYADESALLGHPMHRLTHHTRADGSPYPVEACPTYETCRSARRTHVENEPLWRADGRSFPADYQSHPMLRDGEVVGAVVTFSDMTERLQAREALRRQRDFAESLIETAPVIILVLDAQGRIVRFNPFMAELTGYQLEAVKGQDWFTTFLPERERTRIQAVFQNALSDAPTRGNINPILTRTGQERLIAWHDKTLRDAEGQVIGCLAIGHDITAEKAREAQLFQAQKMEVMGRLTGGIAHDFNNLLTVILGNLELIEEQLPPAGLLRGFAQDAYSAARDGADLTQRLLGFARKTPLHPAPLVLEDFLPQCERLLRRTLNEGIALEVACATPLSPVYADRAQLESALLNLAINAQDALPHGGTLSIVAHRLHVATAGRTDYPTLVPGDYALIRVHDTGTGMSPEQVSRATEPFYTTKPKGTGSGLGLSMVYGFAKDSGGVLRLHSELGRGTTAELVLPIATGRRAQAPEMVTHTKTPRGAGTVLLVEDEARVRKLAKQYLTASGYTVVEAATGDTALERIHSGLRPDLLFSDLALPGTLDGYALACHVVHDHPGLKILLTTGADMDTLARSGFDADRFPLLRKPYSAAALAEAVSQLLAPATD
jgi:PAS domain S-box-containing protein